VFVDSNILKYSASQLMRFRPAIQEISWGGKQHFVEVYDQIIVNPNDNIKNNAQLRLEVDIIPEIVLLQESGNIEFCTTGKLTDNEIVLLVREHFSLTPGGLIKMLDLKRPIYQKTAAYGHFGRELPDFTWEKTDKADLLRKAL
jgi:hypothetical protein